MEKEKKKEEKKKNMYYMERRRRLGAQKAGKGEIRNCKMLLGKRACAPTEPQHQPCKCLSHNFHMID